MRRLALSDPLLVAGGIISAVSSSTVGHAKKQAFSDYQPVCPRQCQRYPHDVTPTPEGGEGAPPSVSRETMGISSPSRRCPALRAIAVNDAYAHNDVLSTSDPNATALQVLPRCTETVSGYECKRPTPVLNGLATTLTSAYAYGFVLTITHATPHGRRVTLFLPLRTPLLAPRKHVDQRQLRLTTVARHSFRGGATTTSRVSRETSGVPAPVCISSPRF